MKQQRRETRARMRWPECPSICCRLFIVLVAIVGYTAERHSAAKLLAEAAQPPPQTIPTFNLQQQQQQQQQSADSAQFQDLNSYLAQFFSGDDDNSHQLTNKTNFSLISQKLVEARELIESLVAQRAAAVATADAAAAAAASDAQSVEEPNDSTLVQDTLIIDRLEAQLAPLAISEPGQILPILSALIKALDGCEPASVDFLNNILQYQTFQGQFLYRLAEFRLVECWRPFVMNVARKIGIGLTKMSTQLFDTLQLIVAIQDEADEAAAAARKKSNQRSQAIVINGNQDEQQPQQANYNQLVYGNRTYLLETINKLKRVYFTEPGQRFKIGLALRRQFRQISADSASTRQVDQMRSFLRDSLIEPCNQVVDRVKIACWGEKKYSKYVNQTLGIALTDLVVENDDRVLDYNLSVFCVCRNLKQRGQLENELLTIMSN